MFDLNTILSAALQQAVEAATKPLLERIEKLESCVIDRHQRLLVLEGALTDRVAALEERGTGGGLTREEVREIADQAAGAMLDSHCADYDHDGGLSEDQVRRIAEEEASEVVDRHCSDYDHDDFVSDFDSALRDSNLSDYIDLDDAVRDAVNNLSFEVSVS